MAARGAHTHLLALPHDFHRHVGPHVAADQVFHSRDQAVGVQGARVDLESRPAFADFVRHEVERWSRIAKTVNIPME